MLVRGTAHTALPVVSRRRYILLSEPLMDGITAILYPAVSQLASSKLAKNQVHRYTEPYIGIDLG